MKFIFLDHETEDLNPPLLDDLTLQSDRISGADLSRDSSGTFRLGDSNAYSAADGNQPFSMEQQPAV
jgi:hypothetical protein